ncbi:MAG: signal peptidase II [Oscillospiraceae bacterium]
MIATIISILGLVIFDRASKVVLELVLADRGLVVLIPNILGLRLLEGGNTGAAFGMLSGNTFFLIFMTAIVLIIMIYVLLFKKFRSPVMKWALILVTAGGIGNLYDRIVYGSVTDFFEFLFMKFAVFNVADCFICVGAFIAVVYLLATLKEKSIFIKEDSSEQKHEQ